MEVTKERLSELEKGAIEIIQSKEKQHRVKKQVDRR